MSGPVGTTDAPPVREAGAPGAACVEVTDGRAATVGRFGVRRALPRRQRRTVGAWCFADHFGPAAVTEDAGMDIGPHPHIGLHTVTWLLAGEVLHRDSLGSEQVVRPGQLNLMTAGHGVSHSEEATGSYRGEVHGVQLWVAQPEETRHGPPGFEHHATLPTLDLDGMRATVLVGDFGGATSPARRDTDLVGVDAAVQPGVTTWPLRPGFEHALLVLTGAVAVDGTGIAVGQMGYLGTGRDELVVTATEDARVLLLGGPPFPDRILMWWNYVARTREEIADADRHWQQGAPRFGQVASRLDRILAPEPPWLT